MSKPLRVLMVEDSEDDALLTVRELRRNDYEPSFERVETPEAMKASLDKQEWDVVLSDYRMPRFDGLAALELARRTELDLPFIVVSGTIGEDVAVAAMRAGAHDYIMKDSLERLVPAIEREIREAGVRRNRRQMEEEVQKAENKYRTLVENLPQKIFLKDIKSIYVSCNGNFARDLGITSEELAGKTDYDFFPKDLAKKYTKDDRRIIDSGATEDMEERYIQDGQEKWVHTIKTPVRNAAGNVSGVLGAFWDITERKKMEEDTKEQLRKLEVFYKANVGREERILELKKQVERLKKELKKHEGDS